MLRSNVFSRRQFAASAASIAALAVLPGRSMANISTQTTGENHMTTLTPYILFDGNCQQAMEFYKSCFGGELTVLKVKDSPAKDHMPPSVQDKILNAQLKSGKLDLSASDWVLLDRTRIAGNSVRLYLRGGTTVELKTLFEKLSDGAEILDPLKETFFGVYGGLNDKFGIRWMFQADKSS
jgi:PhnB protein